VLKGKILDCVIDLRKKSKTFGKSFKILLSEKNNLSLYVPQGFAHSYLTLDNENIVYY
jgi:dTDP-4-dehydrorhamnose 3,5-epimerase